MECGFCMRICEGTTPMAKWQSKLVAYGNWGIIDSYQDMSSETKRAGNGKKEKRERDWARLQWYPLSPTPTEKLEAGKSWQHHSGTCSHGNNNPEPCDSSAWVRRHGLTWEDNEPETWDRCGESNRHSQMQSNSTFQYRLCEDEDKE